MLVDTELWQQVSLQIRQCATQLDDNTLSAVEARSRVLELLQAILQCPDHAGYIQSSMDIVVDATDDKLATKLNAIADELFRYLGVVEQSDQVARGEMGPT